MGAHSAPDDKLNHAPRALGELALEAKGIMSKINNIVQPPGCAIA